MACCLYARVGSEVLAPLDVRDIPGVGKVTEQNLNALGIAQWATWRNLAIAGWKKNSASGGWRWRAKSRGLDAGGWFDAEIGEDDGAEVDQPRAHVLEDTARSRQIESTLMRLSEMVGAAFAGA